jgi:hypothetical protein
MQVFARYVSPRSVVAFALEMALVVASLLLAVHLRGGTDDVLGTLWRIAVIAAICQMCFYYADLYNLTLVHGGRELVARLLTAGGMASLLLAAIYFAIPALILGDGIFVSSLALLPGGDRGLAPALPAGRAQRARCRNGCSSSARARAPARWRARCSISATTPTRSSGSSTTTRPWSAARS